MQRLHGDRMVPAVDVESHGLHAGKKEQSSAKVIACGSSDNQPQAIVESMLPTGKIVTKSWQITD